MAAITEEMKTMKRDKTVVWVNKLYSAARTAPWTRNEMYDRIRGQFDGYVRFMTTGRASPRRTTRCAARSWLRTCLPPYAPHRAPACSATMMCVPSSGCLSDTA